MTTIKDSCSARSPDTKPVAAVYIRTDDLRPGDRVVLHPGEPGSGEMVTASFVEFQERDVEAEVKARGAAGPYPEGTLRLALTNNQEEWPDPWDWYLHADSLVLVLT